MTRVRLAPGVIDDLSRIMEHLELHEAKDAEDRASQIISAFDVLIDNPLIGRPVGDEKRELLIGRGARGYVALYRYVPLIDSALILAVRAQRESGYAQE
ncbi:MAG: type II toxin-antitoxin system RelE/ParE family toxin [Luteimonas sp.]